MQLWTAEQTIAARRLKVVREIDGRDMARRQGATSAAVWLRDKLRVTFHTARHMLSLAKALDGPCQATAAALDAGKVNEQQARIIADTVTGLAEHGPVIQAKAEKVLLHPTCAALEPASLKVAADEVLHHVAPELAEEQGAQRPRSRRQTRRPRPVFHPEPRRHRPGPAIRLAGR